MKINSAPIQALDDTNLEQISGGSIDPVEMTNVAAIAYNQFTQLANSILEPWVENISETAFNIQYGPTLKVLASYNNENYDLNVRASALAKSWNKKHQNSDPMSDNLAEYILSINKIGAQAAIICLPNVTDMENACMAMMNGNS